MLVFVDKKKGYPAGTHLVPKSSSRQRFRDVQNVNSEDAHKT